MKKIPLLLLILTSFFFNVKSSDAQTAALDHAVDSIFKARMIDTTVGTSIGVIIKNPQTGLFIKKLYNFGQKNRTTHEAPDSTTVYQIGSVTKTFTAMIMAHMLRSNTIKRNDRIQSYLSDTISIPYWINGNDTTFITVIDLVTHFSGLIDTPENTSYPYTLARMFSYIDTCHLLSKPDSLWLYSNLGFATLATGLTYKAGRDSIEQLFTQWITDSLGMQSTKITRTQDMILRSAKGYIHNGSGWVLADSNKSTWPAFNGAGAIRSTIKDMTRYMEYQMKILNSSLNPLTDTMHKRIKLIQGKENTWQGMAWAQHHLNHQPTLPWVTFKDGGTPGYNSYIAFYTDTATQFKAGVVILTNSGTTPSFNNSGKVQNITLDLLSYIYPKYGVGVHQISTEVPDRYILQQNYPNPFNPTTKIKFELPKSSFVKITIFDQLGREVNTLVNQELNAGSYETEFIGSNIASGIYYYKIAAGEFFQTKKMIIVK
jgi:CubicO group peptidase (beta-lactamase class C family)